MVGETPKRFVPFREADRSRTDSGPRTMESIAAGHGVITHMDMLVVLSQLALVTWFSSKWRRWMTPSEYVGQLSTNKYFECNVAL